MGAKMNAFDFTLPLLSATNLMQDDFLPLLQQGTALHRIVSSFRCDIAPVSVDPYAEWRAHSRHAPPQREAILILKGKVLFSLNEKVYAGVPGDLFFYDVGEVHDKSMPPESADSITLVFQIYKDFTYAYLSQCAGQIQGISNRILFADPGTTPLLNVAWDRIRAATTSPDTTACTQLFSILDFMMAEIVRRPSTDPGDITIFDLPNMKPSVAQIAGLVMAHIDEHKGRQSSLNEIMHLTGYSASYINRIFQANLGCTITEHANAWRFNRLHDLLQAHVPMKEIAFQLGFSSPTAFSRWKRKQKLRRIHEEKSGIGVE